MYYCSIVFLKLNVLSIYETYVVCPASRLIKSAQLSSLFDLLFQVWVIINSEPENKVQAPLIQDQLDQAYIQAKLKLDSSCQINGEPTLQLTRLDNNFYSSKDSKKVP